MFTTALLKLLGVLWLMRAASRSPSLQPGGGSGNGGGGGGAAPSPATSDTGPSWPTSTNSLPPFPSGWEYDIPPPAEVQQRAAALLSSLWARGQGATTAEQTGGRWITYRAELVADGRKGVTAWRLKGGASASSSAPSQAAARAQPGDAVSVPRNAPAPAQSNTPVEALRDVVTVSTPAGAQTQSPIQTAAVLMQKALNANGYRRSDQPIYKAFQRAIQPSKTPDGFPGPTTMKALGMALQSLALPMPSVPVYPWKSNGAYDGVNAPTRAQWER